MNNNKSEATNTSIGFSGLLAVAFIVLKLCNVINWSWWWVLSPLWIPLAIVLVVALVCLLFKAFIAIRIHRRAKRIQRKYGSGR